MATHDVVEEWVCLDQRIIEEWERSDQRVIDNAVKQWRRLFALVWL